MQQPICAPVIALVVIFVNAIFIRERSRSLIHENPELEPGYRRLFWGFIISMSILWMAMIIGILVGNMIVFRGILITLWLVGFVWICFLGGAEFLIEYYYPIVLGRTHSTTKGVLPHVLGRTPLGLKITCAVGTLIIFLAPLLIHLARELGILELPP